MQEKFVDSPVDKPFLRLLRLQGQHGLSAVGMGLLLIVTIFTGRGQTIPVWELGIWATGFIFVGVFQTISLLNNWCRGRVWSGFFSFVLWFAATAASLMQGNALFGLVFFGIPAVMAFFEFVYSTYEPIK